MKYYFDEGDGAKIKENFGRDFYIKLEASIHPCLERWSIDALALIQSYSANLVFKGHSQVYGPIVMKFARDHGSFTSEVAMLENSTCQSVCKIFDVDYEKMVYIMEAIEPGETLACEENMAVRLEIFCKLHHGLHQEKRSLQAPYVYPTYQEWIRRITTVMDRQEEWQEVTALMKDAEALFHSLALTYSSMCLLHGDFHYYNILKGQEAYKVIDPKGVVGDPLFDIPRYILNEFYDVKDKARLDLEIRQVVKGISQALAYGENDLWKALYIEAAMGICWSIEDGASIGEKDKFLEQLHILRTYINHD